MDDQTPRAMRARGCGECTACCHIVAAQQLNKPTGVACPHVCEAGCAIYETRFEECRSFRCIWLNGHFLDSDRPDQLGVVFFEEADANGNALVTASEAYPGVVLDSPRAKELILQILARGIPVVVRNEHMVTHFSPDGQAARFDVDPNDPLKVCVLPRKAG